MQETDPEILKALDAKLTGLANLILNKASSDTEFAKRLEEILLSDSLKAVLREKRRKFPKSSFNPVNFLHEHGKSKLLEILQEKTDDDLRSILRSTGIQKGRDLKSVDRSQMIDEIVSYSDKKLNQGSAFL